jgi:hypothetical protein
MLCAEVFSTEFTVANNQYRSPHAIAKRTLGFLLGGGCDVEVDGGILGDITFLDSTRLDQLFSVKDQTFIFLLWDDRSLPGGGWRGWGFDFLLFFVLLLLLFLIISLIFLPFFVDLILLSLLAELLLDFSYGRTRFYFQRNNLSGGNFDEDLHLWVLDRKILLGMIEHGEDEAKGYRQEWWKLGEKKRKRVM